MSFIDVTIKNKEFQYKFNITAKFTILTGNSSTGKTTLCRLLNELNSEDHPLFVDGSGYIPPIYCNLYRRVYNLTNYPDYEDILNKTSGNIYVIDETSEIFNNENFYSILINSGNYFILITRDDVVESLPIGVYNVFEIWDKGKKGGVQFNEFKRLFSVDLVQNCFNPDVIVTEDSGAGFEMYGLVFKGKEIYSSEGNSNVANLLMKYKSKNVLLLIDFSAFAPFIRRIEEAARLNDLNVVYFYAESFEHILLSSNIYTNKFDNDLSVHFGLLDLKSQSSYEQYFYDILTEISSNLEYCETYTKKHLTKFLEKSFNVNKVCSLLNKNGVNSCLLNLDNNPANPIDSLKSMIE